MSAFAHSSGNSTRNSCARNSCARLLGACTFMFVAACASQTLAQRASAATGGPFAELNGTWAGSGAVTLSNGGRERIRCRASYTVAGNGYSLRQALNCASDSYRFSLRSDMRVQDGGNLVGNWSDASRSNAGSITGRVRNGNINGMIQGTGFAAEVSVRTSGDRQQVSLSSQGDVRDVSVNLRRTR